MNWKMGEKTRFPPGISGNPGGKSKKQRQFEVALADALISADPVERARELSDITWAAARKFEPWAVQLLFARLAPQTFSMRLETAPDASRMQETFLQALSGLPDEHRYAVARKLIELDRALEASNDGNVQ